MSGRYLTFISTNLIALFANSYGQTRPKVSTTTGTIVGISSTSSLNGSSMVVTSFLGIPYAAPPVAMLRFAKPQPHEPWTEDFDASNYGPHCPQLGNAVFGNKDSFEEDCLTLNVVIPGEVSVNSSLAIMVWFHGGVFTVHGSSTTPGHYDTLATLGQVIVISVNSLLGVFGFLSTGDDCARGNWGLWDQRLALQWVTDNAHNFGGDSRRITSLGNPLAQIVYCIMLYLL